MIKMLAHIIIQFLICLHYNINTIYHIHKKNLKKNTNYFPIESNVQLLLLYY